MQAAAAGDDHGRTVGSRRPLSAVT